MRAIDARDIIAAILTATFYLQRSEEIAARDSDLEDIIKTFFIVCEGLNEEAGKR